VSGASPPEPDGPRSGGLVVVGTPIGNLGDVSERQRRTLGQADVVAAEDTRRTRALLSAIGVSAPALVSLHAHNEAGRADELVERMRAGALVALVSDAGMPAVSDPGQRLVRAALDAGLPVTVVPGPSAALTALVLSGLPTDRFVVEGFLPRQGSERRRRLAELAAERRTVVLFESPRRLAATLGDLSAVLGAERSVAVAREMTKRFEECWRGTLGGGAELFRTRAVRGEVTVVVAGASDLPRLAAATAPPGLPERATELVLGGLRPAEVAQRLVRELGVSRAEAYAEAVAAQRARTRSRSEEPEGEPAPGPSLAEGKSFQSCPGSADDPEGGEESGDERAIGAHPGGGVVPSAVPSDARGSRSARRAPEPPAG